MLNFPFRPGARWLILALIVMGVATMLAACILVLVTENAQMVTPVMVGVVMTGAGFIVTGIATPAPSIEHYRRTGLYLVPAKNGPIETSSKTTMWMGALSLLFLGALIAGAGVYGLAKTRPVASTDTPVATTSDTARPASRNADL